MSHRYYGTRSVLRSLTGLDFGLRVRVEVQSSQRPMFSGSGNACVQHLIPELAKQMSSLRVYSYSLRGQLEQAATAIVLNAACGSWRYARRAALDLAGLLTLAAKRRLADRDLCASAGACALRVAESIAKELR